MKKKVIFTIIGVLSAIFIVSCGKNDVEAKNENELFELVDYFYVDNNVRIDVYRDTETGIQYIGRSEKNGYGGMGGLCPRYNEDGSLYMD